MSEGAGPFSMLSVSALENHIQSVTLGGREYAAIRIDAAGNLTPAMIFCRGLLGYNNRQELELRSGMRPTLVRDGDWIVMVSRTEYDVLRVNESASLFALMPDVRLSTLRARLSRISEAHTKDVDSEGGTHGVCVECYQPWNEEAGGCPTKVWATKDRDVLATWDPADDEPEEGVEDEA